MPPCPRPPDHRFHPPRSGVALGRDRKRIPHRPRDIHHDVRIHSTVMILPPSLQLQRGQRGSTIAPPAAGLPCRSRGRVSHRRSHSIPGLDNSVPQQQQRRSRPEGQFRCPRDREVSSLGRLQRRFFEHHLPPGPAGAAFGRAEHVAASSHSLGLKSNWATASPCLEKMKSVPSSATKAVLALPRS